MKENKNIKEEIAELICSHEWGDLENIKFRSSSGHSDLDISYNCFCVKCGKRSVKRYYEIHGTKYSEPKFEVVDKFIIKPK